MGTRKIEQEVEENEVLGGGWSWVPDHKPRHVRRLVVSKKPNNRKSQSEALEATSKCIYIRGDWEEILSWPLAPRLVHCHSSWHFLTVFFSIAFAVLAVIIGFHVYVVGYKAAGCPGAPVLGVLSKADSQFCFLLFFFCFCFFAFLPQSLRALLKELFCSFIFGKLFPAVNKRNKSTGVT